MKETLFSKYRRKVAASRLATVYGVSAGKIYRYLKDYDSLGRQKRKIGKEYYINTRLELERSLEYAFIHGDDAHVDMVMDIIKSVEKNGVDVRGESMFMHETVSASLREHDREVDPETFNLQKYMPGIPMEVVLENNKGFLAEVSAN